MTDHHTEEEDGESSDDDMTAVRIHEHGGVDVLTVEEVPRPEPDDGEVLVRIHAAGVNPIDWMVREGYVDDALTPSLPFIPGWDLSGVVESVGDDVSAFAVGDDVFGLVGMPDPGNAYAEYAAVSASDIVLKPETVSHRAAVAVPMVALTAWHALFEEGRLQAGQRVLVHAAGGGVGHMAVQLANHTGAHVVGTASGRNEAYLQRLGVDEFVNYHEQQFEAVVNDVDLVLDAVGGDTLERSIDVLKRGGRLVTLPEPPGETIITTARTDRDATVHWFSIEPNAAVLATIRSLIENERIEVTVSDAWPLSEVGAAHEESRDGHARGKLVLDIANEDGE